MKSKAKPQENIFDGHYVGAVVLCAGKGERSGLAYNKVLYHLGQKTVLETVLDNFAAAHIDHVMLVVSPGDRDEVFKLVKPYKNISMTTGGSTRTQSVFNGLKALSRCDIVVIHDGARPYVGPKLINESIASAIRYGSGIVAVPTVDTIKQVSDYKVIRSLSRSGLYNMQTPQTFRYDEIVKAYCNVKGVFTDDSEIYERAGYVPHIVLGTYENIKITHPTDLFKTMPNKTRVGIGFDVHKLVKGRPLILGGVRIAYEKGLLGHSDADVLTHAIMDSILSASDYPDIGVLFPDTAPEFENISSMVLLDKVLILARARGFRINNISAVIIAQQPKMAPYIEEIRKNYAVHMGIETARINISATTTEMLGVVGKGNAIAASASCLLSE